MKTARVPCSCPPCMVRIQGTTIVKVTPAMAVALCSACDEWIASTIATVVPDLVDPNDSDICTECERYFDYPLTTKTAQGCICAGCADYLRAEVAFEDAQGVL